MRFEFLEVIVRMAQLLYKNELSDPANIISPRPKDGDKKKAKKVHKITLPQAIHRLFKEHIDPAEFEVADTNEFRDCHLYTFRVNQFFERNLFVF